MAGGISFLLLGDAAAQTAGTRNAYGTNIVVNNEVLNSLGPSGPAPALPYRGDPHASARVAVHQPGILLFPPPDFPRSQIVHPGAADLALGRQTVLQAPRQKEPPMPDPEMRVEAVALTAEGAVSTENEDPATRIVESEASEAGATPAVAQSALVPMRIVPVVERETLEKAPQEEGEGRSHGSEKAPQQADIVRTTAASAMVATASPRDGVIASVMFSPSSSDLSKDGKAELLDLAETLNADASARVQLLAYAESKTDSPNAARRLSLSRALIVRGFLMDQGLPATRMQVRALGDRFKEGPPDRVDIRRQGG